MKVVSDKELRVTTLSGTAVLFMPNEPREVSETIGLIALQMGAKEANGSQPEPVEERANWFGEAEHAIEEEEAPAEDIPPAEPSEELVGVMEQIINDGNPDDFKSDGKPKASVVNKVAGRTVSTTEREAAWQEALNT